MADSDDEPLTLSSAAMAALQEFFTERDKQAEEFDRLKTAAIAADETEQPEKKNEVKKWSMKAFEEDWNISQFWYSEDVAATYARQLLVDTTKDSVIVVVSAPSTFVQLKNLVGEMNPEDRPQLVLLEHDARFEVFGNEFIWYDFNEPLRLPGSLKGKADRIILDPPFLSEECQTKAAMTVRTIFRPADDGSTDGGDGARLIICTGERMGELITRLYKPLGVRTTDFEVIHSRGLSNEFLCYSNFECNDWKWL